MEAERKRESERQRQQRKRKWASKTKRERWVENKSTSVKLRPNHTSTDKSILAKVYVTVTLFSKFESLDCPHSFRDPRGDYIKVIVLRTSCPVFSDILKLSPINLNIVHAPFLPIIVSIDTVRCHLSSVLLWRVLSLAISPPSHSTPNSNFYLSGRSRYQNDTNTGIQSWLSFQIFLSTFVCCTTHPTHPHTPTNTHTIYTYIQMHAYTRPHTHTHKLSGNLSKQ